MSQDLGVEMCLKSVFKLLEQAQLNNDNNFKEESARILITLGKWLNSGSNITDNTLIKSSIDKSDVLLYFSNKDLSKTGQLIREVISTNTEYINIITICSNLFFVLNFLYICIR